MAGAATAARLRCKRPASQAAHQYARHGRVLSNRSTTTLSARALLRATQTRQDSGPRGLAACHHDEYSRTLYYKVQCGIGVSRAAGRDSQWHERVGMKTWLRRVRGTIGMGFTWAIAGSAAGMLISLGFVLRTGSRPDAPFPIMFGVLGFVAGVAFSGVLRLVEGRRRFDQMSLSRFAAWGAAVGLALSATFFLVVSRGDPAFLRYFVVVGPVVAVAAAGCAAGSLALASRAQDRELLEKTEVGPAVGRPEGESRKPLRDGR
jgi:hypothetical protein